MAEDLKFLMTSRSSIKGRITTFEKYIEILSVAEPNKLSKTQIAEIQLRLAHFKTLFESFLEVQSKLELSGTALDEHLEERDKIESRFFSLIAAAQTIVDSVIEVQQPSHAAQNSVKSECTCSSNSKQCNVKLPIIQLPTFDGNYMKWLEFRDTYESLIHKNESIPAINKFHYLRSSIEGSAAVVIKSIAFTSDNYKLAWDMLCERYDNKRILINSHLKSLFKFEPIVKESHKSLRYMIDHYMKNLRALNSLGEPTDAWDTLIIYIMSQRLDVATGRKWEEHKSTSVSKDSLLHEVSHEATLDIPQLDRFYQFLRSRADVLETLQHSDGEGSPRSDRAQYNKGRQVKSFLSSEKRNTGCVMCGQNHFIHKCDKFKHMNIEARLAEVRKRKLCLNCLRPGHRQDHCHSGACRVCNRQHHTLLHIGNPHTNAHENSSATRSHSPAACTPPVSLSALIPTQVLLCTAQVEVINTRNGSTYLAKALLDGGSQSSFVSENIKEKLKLCCARRSPVAIAGINNTLTNSTQYCDLQIRSKVNSFQTKVSCLVIPQITSRLPSVEVDTSRLNLPSNIQLADPSFFSPSDIDLLLGADICWEIMDSRQIKLGRNKPTLQGSRLGWLVAGPIGKDPIDTIHTNFSREIKDSLKRFWEIEELSLDTPRKLLTADEQCVEDHFVETTRRSTDGTFTVKIPFREVPDITLGNSYDIANRRFLNLERKLAKAPRIKGDYNNFIKEYEQLGHLTQVERPSFGIYLPHHAVLKENSETTKLRVVFDASCKTTTGKSLNDIQLVGPVVQDDLMSILLRFRQHSYVVTGDIEKMYRCIKVDESQRHLQLIRWRNDPSQPIRTLQLNTVTYGTASAPFLSTRCLIQLANECPSDTVATVMRHDFYVDDLITGSNYKAELKALVTEVAHTLAGGGFSLRKFRTNSPDIFDENTQGQNSQDFSKESTVLGLKWIPDADTLQFTSNIELTKVTKRTILSTSCKIFDPLGLLSACTIIPKMILQKLWLLKSSWDEPVPDDIGLNWQEFANHLRELSNIRVPRHALCAGATNVELHCFSDASQRAYGACIYLKSEDSQGTTVRLLCAKARVAPLKPVTIPRLELCGALLGARLYTKVCRALRIKISRSVMWTDSTIVLGWIKTQPTTLNTFVCNRVQEIRELTTQITWRHVPTDKNPADLASRGVKPQQLQGCHLWWQGPSFLTRSEIEWPFNNVVNMVLPEVRVYLNVQGEQGWTLVDKFSRLHTLLRVTAYILRFIHNCKNKNNRTRGHLTSSELHKSVNTLAKISQRESFAQDIHLLAKTGSVNSKSTILSLNPFLDQEGVLRVGGRIQDASHCPYNKRHPILLDGRHAFTKLLFAAEHLRLLHCGPQQLLSAIREQFWPTVGRLQARATVNRCIQCTRVRGKTLQPMMGNLPKPRVTPAPPFETCGTDFAGPFLMSNHKGRGAKTSKCYLCLFICFSTKAIHLEVVSDLSTSAFILCLRRFISRRGKPQTIYCDNGKTFIGANNELRRLVRNANPSFRHFVCGEGIEFKFSPAYAPNFGGIWEAGVKSAKYHLKRITGNTNLTFEELTTLFAQIEAVLNSRPLTPLSADPNDLTPLTPGHFLIGRPMASLPAQPTEAITVNRYRRLEQLRQHFWGRWSKEFLSDLQQRMKWRKKGQSIKLGEMVILRDDQKPPMKWALGRIAGVHAGPDGITRVVDVKTAKGVIRRAVSRLCRLPSDINEGS